MNIYEVHEKYKIGVRKLRKMHADGVLRCDGDNSEIAAQMRLYLSRGQHLTVRHLLALVEDPSIFFDLGRYEYEAEAQLKALGNVQGEVAPREVTASIHSVSNEYDPEAMAILIGWLRSVVPERPVSHYWIAVRLALGVPPTIWKFEVLRIPRALLRCRNHREFAGWWHTRQVHGRTETIYQRPKQIFDL